MVMYLLYSQNISEYGNFEIKILWLLNLPFYKIIDLHGLEGC